ncbi:MAG: 30S ribosomal protein S16 [Mycoplasma sp.]|nr:30S ribosomal protein S16 [Candidatus Hennigella equi]
MVKIRLTKLGRHKLPAYRVIAIDSRKRRDGAYLHLLGTYDPVKGVAKLDEELTLKLLAQGAQPCDTVLSILKKQGIYAKFLASKKQKPAKKGKRKLSKKKVAKKLAKKNAPKKAKPAANPAPAAKAEEPAKEVK